jgi:error-prone DNA polymerase
MASRLMLVDGVIQRSKEGVIHVMADRIVDRTEVLGALSDMHGAETPLSPADELTHTPQAYGYRESRSPTARHPRNVRLLPPSRDFR